LVGITTTASACCLDTPLQSSTNHVTQGHLIIT